MILVPWPAIREALDTGDLEAAGLRIGLFSGDEPGPDNLAGVLFFTVPYDRPFGTEPLGRIKGARAVQALTAGYEHLLGKLPAGATLCNARGLHDASTAEHALALILAAALAAASIILIVEVVAHAVHASPVIVHWPTWYKWAGRTHWNALVVTIWSIILIIAWRLVLAPQLKPRRVTRLQLRSDDKATDAAMTRGGLAGALRAAALDIDGISKAAIKVRRRRARVTATAAVAGPPGPSSGTGPPPGAGRRAPSSPEACTSTPDMPVT